LSTVIDNPLTVCTPNHNFCIECWYDADS